MTKNKNRNKQTNTNKKTKAFVLSPYFNNATFDKSQGTQYSSPNKLGISAEGAWREGGGGGVQY